MARCASLSRLIIGLLLAILGSGYLLQFSAPPVQAENLTVTATLNQVSSFSLSSYNVALPAGPAGQTVNSESTPVGVTVATNRDGVWALQVNAASDSLVGPGGDSIPVGMLQWKGGIVTDYRPLSIVPALIGSGTGPTPESGTIYPLSFSFTYPWGHKPGTYSVQLVLTFS